MGGEQRAARPGWVRDVELPRSLDELRGPTSGLVLREAWAPLVDSTRRERLEDR